MDTILSIIGFIICAVSLLLGGYYLEWGMVKHAFVVRLVGLVLLLIILGVLIYGII